MPSNIELLNKCKQVLPGFVFASAKSFYWSPRTKTVYINQNTLQTPEGQMALLHEVSHALLGHNHYQFDFELVALEAAAWQLASQKATEWSVPVDTDHIEDCLDTYRDWLYARSTCPTCSMNAPQISKSEYKCINCSTKWSVSPSRFCRSYRMQSRPQKIPPQRAETVFN